MSTLTTAARTFWNDEEGASMAEYALLLGLIAVAIAGVIGTFGQTIRQKFQDADTALQGGGAGGTE